MQLSGSSTIVERCAATSLQLLAWEESVNIEGTEESPSDSMFFSSSKLHEYIDELVDNFWKVKAEKGEKGAEEEDFECPKFDLLTPTPPEDTNKIINDVVSELHNVGEKCDQGIQHIRTPPSRRPCTENMQHNFDVQAGREGTSHRRVVWLVPDTFPLLLPC